MIIAWYPLDGNLEDYSGNGYHLTGDSAVISNDGKIGKCYSFDANSARRLYVKNFPQYTSNFTWTCWVNQTASSTSRQMIVSQGRDVINYGINITAVNNTISIPIGSNNSMSYTYDLVGKWTHIALVADSSKVYLYVNGSLVQTINLPPIDFGQIETSDKAFVIGKMAYSYTGTGTYFPFNGKINDVRVYNEALSVKEIKEIAKAKILHYNFNAENQGVVANFYPNDCPYSRLAHGLTSSSGVVTGITPPVPGANVYKIYEDGVDSQNVRYSVKFNAKDLGLMDKELCLSYYILVPVEYRSRVTGFSVDMYQNSTGTDWHGSIGYNSTYDYYSAGGIIIKSTDTIGYDKTKAGYWQRVSVIIKPQSSKIKVTTDNNDKENNIYIAGYLRVNFSEAVNGGTPYHLYVSCPQLELGNIPTEYKAPGTRNILGIHDNSGFRNDGIVALASSPYMTKDSLYGSNCYTFNGVNSFINIGNRCKIKDSITISTWVYKSNWSSDTASRRIVSCTEAGGWQLSFNDSSGYVTMIAYKGTGYHYAKYARSSISAGWHHIVGVFDGRYVKLYIDGNLSASADTGSVGELTYHSGNSILIGAEAGSSSSPAGSYWDSMIDDVRIYATALSDVDVKDLYQSRGSVSKNGKVLVNEIIETPTNQAGNTTKLLEIRSMGYNTNGLLSYVKLGGTTVINGGRSYTVSTISRDLVTTTGKTFDVYGNVDNATAMVDYLKTLNDDDYIIIVTYDYPANNRTVIGDYLNTLGLNFKNYPWNTRDSYAAVFRKCGDILFESHDKFVSDTTPTNIVYSTTLKSGNTVNKKGQLLTNEIIEVPTANLETKTAYGVDWVQLFYHNSKNGTVLFGNDKSEFLKCNTSDKISNLYLLELFRGKDGKFELLLEYESEGTLYNRWKQSSNFTSEPVAGYEAISCSWTINSWGGLEYNGGSSCWADGSVNTSMWHYSVGAKVSFTSNSITGMPKHNGAEPGWVKVWVRCDNPNVFKIYKNGCTRATEFIEV